MPSCLGIYIEDKIVKYAKVSKDKDNIKVESFDIKFYDDLKKTIEDIIQETNSEKTPIAINVSGEMYNYFDVISLLSPSDIKKSINIEFEVLCKEKGYNKELLDVKNLTIPNPNDMDKLDVVNIALNKIELENRIKCFERGKIVSARPITTSILNLLRVKRDTNCIVVNIEDRTSFTSIKDGNLDYIDTIPDGMKEILDKISERENSYSKAYEACKNTTLSSRSITAEEEGEYINLITPTLFNIANEIKKRINQFQGNIRNVYITGSGSFINNIDLYFQDYLNDVHCEILKPSFLEATSLKIGIKEYIEVNSAIALALDGLGMGIKDVNFYGAGKVIDFGGSGISRTKTSYKPSGGKIKADEKLLIRIIATVAIFVVGYGIISNSVSENYKKKEKDVASVRETTLADIKKVTDDKKNLDNITKKYEERIKILEGKTIESEDSSYDVDLPKDSLPNFLNQLMFVIPQGVTVTNLQNTQGIHFKMDVSSKEYQQIGLFKAILYNKNILTNVTSTGSVKDGDNVSVTIEGDIP